MSSDEDLLQVAQVVGLEESEEDSTSDESETSSVISDNPILPIPSCNYTEEVTDLLINHQIASHENALVLNKRMQQLLIQLRCKLQSMLQKCQEKYTSNETEIKALHSSKLGKVTATKFCGAPFFKTLKHSVAPLNPDYVNRKVKLREYFPMDDFGAKQRHWLLKDKVSLIKGVKQQIIDFLITKPIPKSMLPKNKKNTPEKSVEEQIVDFKNNLDAKRLADLYQMALNFKEFEIDWSDLTIQYFGSRHKSEQCIAMWNAYLRPDLNRKAWTKDEETKLLQAVKVHNYQNWDNIAEMMDKRSPYQCHLYYQTVLRLKIDYKKGKWTPAEDNLLLSAIESHRIGNIINWTRVASHFPDKPKAQVYSRYKYKLHPDINKAPFTPEEDCILMAAVQEYGEKFTCIPKSLFPGRTLVQIRCRYMNVLRHTKTQKFWSCEEDKKLMNLISIYGTKNWADIAKVLKGHTRISCRTRYLVIQKFFKKHPNGKIEDIPRKKRKVSTDVSTENWVDKFIKIKQQTEPTQKVVVPKKNFVERLRSVKREYYEFLKYSYDFEFGKDRRSAYNNIVNIQVLSHIFKVPMRTMKSTEQVKQLEYKIVKQELTKDRRLTNTHFMPPSWSTVLGLRAVTIAVNDCKKASNKQTNAYESSLAKFKNIFFTTFYKTALLTKIHPSIASKGPVFEVRILEPEECDNENPESVSTIEEINIDVKPIPSSSVDTKSPIKRKTTIKPVGKVKRIKIEP